MLNALTIDVEEYFHPNAMDGVLPPADWEAAPRRVEHNTHAMLDLLSAHDTRATFFVLGWVAERFPGLVRDIAARGHEIACHGYAHRLVYTLGPAAFREDVARARGILEDSLGAAVTGFRAASFSIVRDTLWALDILIEEGFRYDSSIFPVHHDLYGIPEFSRRPVRVQCTAGEILEIPASTVHLLGRNWPVAGGGYFRLLPYGVTRWALTRINTADHLPALVYVHPWEIDPDQPRLPAPALARFRQYTNIGATAGRLHRLLSEFRFAPINEALRDVCAAAPALDVTAVAERASGVVPQGAARSTAQVDSVETP
jgi:polysaccharide deacetylase family protein (PEP-CTERM system associated)